MSFLLDTSTLIDLFVNRKDAPRIRDYLQSKFFSVSTVTFYEINKTKSPDPRLDVFFKNCNLVSLDPESAKRSSEIYKKLRERGEMINELDILIAGISIQNNLELVTKDNDFKKIAVIEPDFKLKLF